MSLPRPVFGSGDFDLAMAAAISASTPGSASVLAASWCLAMRPSSSYQMNEPCAMNIATVASSA